MARSSDATGTDTCARAPASHSRSPDSEAFHATVFGGRPFLASAALEAGVVTRRELARSFNRLHPGVYALASGELEPASLVRAAWLGAPDGSVVCGFSAALLHGERFFGAEAVHREVELLCPTRARARPGVRMRFARPLGPGTRGQATDGTPVTSPVRTAVDLLRWIDDDEKAVAATDSLCNVTGARLAEVAMMATGMRPAHGVARALTRLALCDPRADSPRETRLRLMMARHGLPTPSLQVPVFDGQRKIATADLCFEWCRVALFYDSREFHCGEQSEYDAYATARRREMGWEPVRISVRMVADEKTLMRQIRGVIKWQILKGEGAGTPELLAMEGIWQQW